MEKGRVKANGKASRTSAVAIGARRCDAMRIGPATNGHGMGGMSEGDDSDGSVMVEPTVVLIRRIRAGDKGAREQLLRRFLPLLQRWAHGRLPRQMRDLNETDDLVQVTLVKALARLD